MDNILAAIDFSDVTDEVLKKAAELAKQLSAHLWIVHVAAPEPEFVGYDEEPSHERDWRAKTLREEHRLIQEKADSLDDAIEVTPLLLQGPTVKVLLHEALKLKADLLVVGSHGRSAVYNMLVGNVTESLLRSASHPILIVPTQAKENN